MMDERRGISSREIRETEREIPVMTAYVLRHGETSADKSDPNRGLTPEGAEQLTRAAERLAGELDPQTDVIQIFDSGNTRAEMSVMLIAEHLKKAGFRFFEPIKMRWDPKSGGVYPEQEGVTTTDSPASRSRKDIAAARIPESYKKQLADPGLHSELNLPDEIGDKRVAAWFLADWPDDVEKPEEVVERVERGIEQAQQRLPMLAGQLGPDKRVVVISAANGTALDAVITDRTGLTPLARQGGVENAEGFKIDFSLDEKPALSVWGETIERQVSSQMDQR